MRNLLIYLLFTCFSCFASGAVLQSQYGDDDGLGLGLADGDTFYWGDIPRTGSNLSDIWLRGDVSVDLEYDLSGFGSLQSASLLLGTGGQGWEGATSLYIDGALVGQLSDGDEQGNYYRRDSFNLTPFLNLIDGADTIYFDLAGDGDGWSLDFVQLTLTNLPLIDDPFAVPTPAAAMLFCSALLSLFCIRKR